MGFSRQPRGLAKNNPILLGDKAPATAAATAVSQDPGPNYLPFILSRWTSIFLFRRRDVPRTTLRAAHVEEQPFLCRHRGADAGAWHRGQHGYVQRGERRAVAAVGLPQRLSYRTVKHL